MKFIYAVDAVVIFPIKFLVAVICHRQLCGGLADRDVVEARRTNHRRAVGLRRPPGPRFLLLHLDRDSSAARLPVLLETTSGKGLKGRRVIPFKAGFSANQQDMTLI